MNQTKLADIKKQILATEERMHKENQKTLQMLRHQHRDASDAIHAAHAENLRALKDLMQTVTSTE